MKITKARPFSRDKTVRFEGFRNRDIFEIEQRWLWVEILIKHIHCDKCGSEDRITFHSRDIPRLIRILTKLNKELYKPRG
jgi:hypothetical protein